MESETEMKELKKLIVLGKMRESAVQADVRPYLKVLEELSEAEEWYILRGEKLVPPRGVRRKVCELAHEDHLGHTLTKQRVR